MNSCFDICISVRKPYTSIIFLVESPCAEGSRRSSRTNLQVLVLGSEILVVGH